MNLLSFTLTFLLFKNHKSKLLTVKLILPETKHSHLGNLGTEGLSVCDLSRVSWQHVGSPGEGHLCWDSRRKRVPEPRQTSVRTPPQTAVGSVYPGADGAVYVRLGQTSVVMTASLWLSLRSLLSTAIILQ